MIQAEERKTLRQLKNTENNIQTPVPSPAPHKFLGKHIRLVRVQDLGIKGPLPMATPPPTPTPLAARINLAWTSAQEEQDRNVTPPPRLHGISLADGGIITRSQEEIDKIKLMEMTLDQWKEKAGNFPSSTAFNASNPHLDGTRADASTCTFPAEFAPQFNDLALKQVIARTGTFPTKHPVPSQEENQVSIQIQTDESYMTSKLYAQRKALYLAGLRGKNKSSQKRLICTLHPVRLTGTNVIKYVDSTYQKLILKTHDDDNLSSEPSTSQENGNY